MEIKRLKDIVYTIEDMKNACYNFFVLRLVYNIEYYTFVNVNDFSGRIKNAYITEHKVKELLR